MIRNQTNARSFTAQPQAPAFELGQRMWMSGKQTYSTSL